MNEIEEMLIKYWENTCVGAVIFRFENAMKELGFEKKDHRKKHQNKVYNAYNEYGNRATCGAYNDDNDDYGQEIFQVVCRKNCGDYLIIAYKGERVFECDFRGIVTLDKENLAKCIKEFSPFFEGIIKENEDERV